MSSFNQQYLSNETTKKFYDLITSGKIDIRTLNMNSIAESQAWICAVNERPNALLASLSAKTDVEKDLIMTAIIANPKLFLNLSESQYFNEVIDYYLWSRFNQTLDSFVKENGDNQVWVEKNYSDQITLSLVYNTKDGEQYYYFDKELNIPTTLVSCVNVSFVISDSKAFLKYMNRSVDTITFNSAYNVVLSLFSKYYRKALSNILEEKGTGYYKIHSKFDDISELVADYAKKESSKTGIEIGCLAIKKIDIPDDTRNLLENQSFAIRQMEAEHEHYLNYVEKSMHAYEMKAEIKKKYPEIEDALTEAEKDLALRRYLIKNGKLPFAKETDINRKNLQTRKETKSRGMQIKQGDAYEKIEPTKKESPIYAIRIIVTLLCLLVSVGLFAVSTGVALIALAVTSLLFGILTLLTKKTDETKISANDVRQEIFNNNNNIKSNQVELSNDNKEGNNNEQ